MDVIWTAANKTKVPRGSLTTIGHCPTLQKFRTAIAYSKKDSAAGLTGLSYNMLKIAPLSAITAIHDCLTAMWVDKEIFFLVFT